MVSKYILTLQVLIIQIIFFSSGFSNHLLRTKRFHDPNSSILANLLPGGSRSISLQPDYPDIPLRPSFSELTKKLQEQSNGGMELVKDGDPVYDNEFPGQKEITKPYDSIIQKTFSVKSDELLSIVLEAVMSLNYNLKNFDVARKVLIISDHLKNKIIVSIQNDENNSVVKIEGYNFILGKMTLSRSMDKLLTEICNLNEKIK